MASAEPVREGLHVNHEYICQVLEDKFRDGHFINCNLSTIDTKAYLEIVINLLTSITLPLDASAAVKAIHRSSIEELQNHLTSSHSAYAILTSLHGVFCHREQNRNRPFVDSIHPLLQKETYQQINLCQKNLFSLAKNGNLTSEDCNNAIILWNKCQHDLRNIVENLINDFLPHRRYGSTSRINLAVDIFKKVFNEVLQLYKHLFRLREVGVFNEILGIVSEHLKTLIANSFIITCFPQNGIVKKQTRGALGTRVPITLQNLLPLEELRIQPNEFQITVKYCEGNQSVQSIPVRWKVPPSSSTIKTYVSQDLKVQGEAQAPGAQDGVGARVTDKKGKFLFEADFLPKRHHCLPHLPPVKIQRYSDTVICVIHTNQEWHADLNLFLDYFYALPNRQDFGIESQVNVNQLVDNMSDYVQLFADRGFSHSFQRSFMKDRLLSSCAAAAVVATNGGGGGGENNRDEMIELSLLSEEHNGIVFWQWFWNAIRMLRLRKKQKDQFLNCLRKMWMDDLLVGFISKSRAQQLCKSVDGGFVLRFSESKHSEITVTTAKNSWVPFKEKELLAQSLVEQIKNFEVLENFAHLPSTLRCKQERLRTYGQFMTRILEGYALRPPPLCALNFIPPPSEANPSSVADTQSEVFTPSEVDMDEDL